MSNKIHLRFGRNLNQIDVYLTEDEAKNLRAHLDICLSAKAPIVIEPRMDAGAAAAGVEKAYSQPDIG